MKRTNLLVGGALLLASLFTTSCKEFMSNLDEPVSSYLSVSDTSVVLNLDTVYQIKANSINSDKAITYKCSDESIATVDANGLVTPVGNKEGDVVITVSVAASDNYNAGEQKVKIAVKQPLTFEALEDGSIDVNYFNDINLPKPIVYTINRTNKKEITGSTSIAVKKGDKIQFESANEATAFGIYDYVNIQPQSQCAVYGNVTSMISPDGNYHTNKVLSQPYALSGLLEGTYSWGDDINYKTVSHEVYDLFLPATTLTSYCYYNLLRSTGITKAPELPATTLTPYCYASMFNYCQKLTKAPKLPAKELAMACYYYMFSQCGLTEAPELPATELASGCYFYMFRYNWSLEKAPALPATEMAPQCYQGMFQYCGLTEAPELPAKKLSYRCYRSMFESCYSMTKAPALPATTLESGCYSNMFSSCYALGGSIVLPAEELPAECYYYMFFYCRKLEKVECLATSMTGNNALTNWLNEAGTELETNPVFVRAEANNKWKNKDGWAVSQTPNDWYIPTNWTIEPPIAVENIRVKTYTDGAFPYWSTNNCVTSVINGAAHYVPTGSWNQFVCLPGSENPLAAGDYVFILDINSDKDLDANMVDLTIRKGWGSDGNPVTAKVPIKAGRHSYRLELPGVIGGNYDCYFTPGTADATLDLYSVSVNKVVE